MVLYLGPDKTGSTWLYETLRSSPQISFPGAKDVFYFDRFHDRGWRWYAGLYAPDAPIWCDLTHDYVFSRAALERVAEVPIPVKFLCVLRPPGERAYSAYRYMQSQGRIPKDVTFAAAVEAVDELVGHGRYVENLAPWVDRFGPQSVHPIRFESIAIAPDLVSEGVGCFLGLDALVPPEGAANAARSARVPGVVRSLRSVSWVMRSLGAHVMVQRVKESAAVRRTLFSSATPPLSEDDLGVIREIEAELDTDRARLEDWFGVTW